MTICNQLCEWNGYKHGCRKPYFEVCPLSNSVSYKPNHMTNADRVRAMSDEELAVWLTENGWDCHLCSEHWQLDNEPLLRGEKCDEKCSEHCLEWLRKTAAEEE